MDGLYWKTGKPYFLMDDLGGKPTILGNPPYAQIFHHIKMESIQVEGGFRES